MKYDVAIIGRTIAYILASLVGRRTFADPPEMLDALKLLHAPEAALP